MGDVKRLVSAVKKAPAKKAAAKKAPVKKVPAKKVPAKKVAAKKTAVIPVAVEEFPRMKEAVKRILPRDTSKKIKPPLTEGLTFPDVGLHIAVLGALLDMKAVSAELVQASLEGLDFDDDASETERLLAAMARLHALKLDPKQVARIKSLDFDGGNEIYMLLEDGAEVETGGEDDTYCLGALTGLSALSGLESLSLDGHGYREKTLDLKPLEGLAALKAIRLSGKCKSAKSLETLPKLALLDLRLASVDSSTVLDRLAKRGVKIQRSSE